MISLTLIHSKRQFLLLIFANLIIQLGITYYIMEKSNIATYNKIGFWIIFALQLIIVYALVSFKIHPMLKFLLFSALSGLFGLSMTNLKTKYNPLAIKTAVESALSIFGAMFAFGIALVLFGVHIGPKVGFVLLFALFALIIARIIALISNITYKIFSVISVILFSIYIVYDTNVILQRNYNGDFISASIAYYHDILNIFSGIIGTNE